MQVPPWFAHKKERGENSYDIEEIASPSLTAVDTMENIKIRRFVWMWALF